MQQTALPPPPTYKPPLEPYLSVLHRDEDILVISKPSGLLSVPGKTPDLADCLESRAKEAHPRARIVHRLDLPTSGVMVMGLNRAAHRAISLQFEKRQTAKTYIARVWGHIQDDSGQVDLPLICDWPNRPKQMVDFERGKSAQTDWAVLEREDGPHAITRVKLSPITGRSHQLRVRMLALGDGVWPKLGGTATAA